MPTNDMEPPQPQNQANLCTASHEMDAADYEAKQAAEMEAGAATMPMPLPLPVVRQREPDEDTPRRKGALFT